MALGLAPLRRLGCPLVRPLPALCQRLLAQPRRVLGADGRLVPGASNLRKDQQKRGVRGGQCGRCRLPPPPAAARRRERALARTGLKRSASCPSFSSSLRADMAAAAAALQTLLVGRATMGGPALPQAIGQSAIKEHVAAAPGRGAWGCLRIGRLLRAQQGAGSAVGAAFDAHCRLLSIALDTPCQLQCAQLAPSARQCRAPRSCSA